MRNYAYGGVYKVVGTLSIPKTKKVMLPEEIERNFIDSFNESTKKVWAASRKGMDASHTKSGIRYKPSSVNRGSKTDMAGDRRERGGC